ncbi:beta 1-4 rhamnosyltransferase Cps2T [Eggerthella lenta]|uniref:beta 1-4 rhamnosyltransferase Cps2T n=1 Tax=Eggerthella lenta TaxID=84112 RepID=UPI0022E0B0B6|nr:DUF1972 domain-containing protein [Eggerthella lenta]
MGDGIRHVYIVGCKGIPARYGGFETFVEKLTENRASDRIRYHVACAVDEMPEEPEYEHNGAHCFCVKWRPLGAARAVFYDLEALGWAISHAERNGFEHPVFYVLACRIGPFVGRFARKIREIGGSLLVNPDGHEWMRAKWSAPVRRYWKLSEAGMVKRADLLVCDSRTIERYIHDEYARFSPETAYIAYGADTAPSKLDDDDPAFAGWFEENGLEPNGYYLAVGRFVPENNYETMIREFMASDTDRAFALVTGVDEGFLDELEKRTGFRSDPRIRFVGTVYDQELLKKIRENAFAYLHGHEVGGTNPSLLEALASTRLSLLLDVGFNREVAEGAALYWTKEQGSLARLIRRADSLTRRDINMYDEMSKSEILNRFLWRMIAQQYEKMFIRISLRCDRKLTKPVNRNS